MLCDMDIQTDNIRYTDSTETGKQDHVTLKSYPYIQIINMSVISLDLN